MRPSYWLLIGCLVTAVVVTVALEGPFRRTLGDKLGMCLAGAVLLACYGVCVAAVSLLLSHFFDVREWLSIVVGLPLGVMLLIVAAKAADDG